MTPRLIPFKAEHLLDFVDRDLVMLCDIELGVARERGGPAFTGMIDDTVLGCAGVTLLWPGVGIAWMVLSKEIDHFGIWMTKMVRAALSDVMRSCNLRRVEAVVLADDARNLRWIRTLGFARENGLARAYTQDKRDVVRLS